MIEPEFEIDEEDFCEAAQFKLLRISEPSIFIVSYLWIIEFPCYGDICFTDILN